MSEKIAVILFNLGGPDSPQAIRPFLFNFFRDPNIIRLPFILRWLLAALIAFTRSRREAAAAYGLIGGFSPLLENTQAQARALEQTLGPAYRVFVCMRYWHPMAGDVAAEVKRYAPARLVLLPLYPQYSTTTTRSAFQAWARAAQAAGLSMPASSIESYPVDPGFIRSSVILISRVYAEAQKEARVKNLPAPRLLFSAHGLPESIIRAGDPYQQQCEQTAAAIRAQLAEKPESVLCYQSRVGRQKWIGPSTEDELRRAGKDNVPVVIYPLAFVNEHVETLAEIEIEYRHKAKEWGVPLFYRVPTVGVERDFIEGLARLVKNANS